MSTHTIPPMAFDPTKESPQAVRQRIVSQISLYLALLIAPATLLVVLVEHFRGNGGPQLYAYGAMQLFAVAAFLFGRGQRPVVQGVLIAAYGYFVFVVSSLHFGPAIGLGIVAVVGAIWGGLMYGRRGSVATALVAAVTLIGLGGLYALGLLHAKLDALDPSLAINWVRFTLVMLGGVIGIGWLVVRLLGEYQAGVERAEEALRRERSERQRNEQLTDQLSLSQRTETMHRLAGGVGHDINNALAVVLCNAEILAESEDPLEVELAQEILEAARNASATSRHLVALDRGLTQARGSSSAAEVLGRVEKLLRRTLPGSITTVIDDRSRERLAMGGEALERCLLNLCLNARDAMSGGGTLKIAVFPTEVGPWAGGHTIEVTDTGTGMDDDTQKRVFEPFFTTKPPGSGSGLGLSTVRELVQACGGTLRLSSKLGRGSRFAIELPPYGSIGLRRAATPQPLARVRRLSLLLVEDDEHVRLAIARILRREGHDVVESAEGRSALAEVAADREFDALIVDGVLPGNDSPEIIARFRSAHPAARIVVCSGYSEDVLRQRGLDLEDCVRLPKPFARVELLRALEGPRSASRPPSRRP